MGTNPSSIDHIIPNVTSLFMKSCTVETRISDYLKLIMSICRMTLPKVKVKNYFVAVIKILVVNFSEETLVKNLAGTELSLKSFEAKFSLTLEKFAPLNEKYFR